MVHVVRGIFGAGEIGGLSRMNIQLQAKLQLTIVNWLVDEINWPGSVDSREEMSRLMMGAAAGVLDAYVEGTKQASATEDYQE